MSEQERPVLNGGFEVVPCQHGGFIVMPNHISVRSDIIWSPIAAFETYEGMLNWLGRVSHSGSDVGAAK